jgi:Fis family transcriptional regulator
VNKRAGNHNHHGPNEIAKSVERSLDDYFRRLDGETPSGLYDMVMAPAERALIMSVMRQAEGNQTHAAAMLGMNRNTLRSKIRMYDIK